MELNKLTEIMEIKDDKLLKNVKTRWIFMLEPAKRVLNEYYTLVTFDFVTNKSTNVNFKLLCDTKVLYGLLDSLMKLAQAWDFLLLTCCNNQGLSSKSILTFYVLGDIAFKYDVFYSFKSLAWILLMNYSSCNGY